MQEQSGTDFEPFVPFVAEYQMMGDMEGTEWANSVLAAEMDKEHESRISGFRVLGSVPGLWGIQLIIFMVDVPVRVFEGRSITKREDAKEFVTGILNEVVGDSDVEVRWVGNAVGVKA